jgi:hypothetical protein
MSGYRKPPGTEAAMVRLADQRGAPCACGDDGRLCLAHYGLLGVRDQLAARTRLGVRGELSSREVRRLHQAGAG